MDATPLILTTQMLLVVLCAASATVLCASAFDRRRARRQLIPLLSLAAVLVLNVMAAVWQNVPSGQLSFVLVPVLLSTFPDGRFVPRWTLWLSIAWVPLTVAILILGDGLVAQPWWWAVPTASGLALLGAQLYRYLRRSTTAEREAARWAILGIGASMALFLVLSMFGEIGERGTPSEAWANLAAVPYLIGPVIGLLRPRLWNVDAALRGFLATIASALPLAVVYAGVMTLAAASGAPSVAAGWWAAAAVAATAYPLIRLALRLATVIVYRGRGDADEAVARLGERLDDLPDPLAVSQTVAQSVADALRADRVEVRGDGVFSARVGLSDDLSGKLGTPQEFPIGFHGDVLAILVVWPRPGEQTLTAHDRLVVSRLALHSAPALHGARALADLSATYARLVLAREEERRRLRRDLHDDLSPTLSGLRLGAAALAKRAAATDRGLAVAAEDLATDIQAAVEQTREIAYGLRPPILDDRGLVAAIRDRVHGQAADRVRVEIIAPADPLLLPAAVDLAALRIVQEAVANVRRHAEATRCTIVIERSTGELRIRVDDDGRGIPLHVSAGMGLASIRERVGELGGSAVIGASASGGGHIAVRLPFDEATPSVQEVA